MGIRPEDDGEVKVGLSPIGINYLQRSVEKQRATTTTTIIVIVATTTTTTKRTVVERLASRPAELIIYSEASNPSRISPPTTTTKRTNPSRISGRGGREPDSHQGGTGREPWALAGRCGSRTPSRISPPTTTTTST